MKSKLIMILGAGPSQVPVIKAAKELGLKVAATDRNPDAVGFKVADCHFAVDIVDAEATTKLAEELAIDGILACGDISVGTAAAVAYHLGLPGLKPEVARIATDKFAFWEKFRQYGVPYPKSGLASTYKEALDTAKDILFPVIVKPTLALGGSRGVMRINDLEHLETGFEFAQQASRDGLVLLEEFLEGIEHTVESLVYHGKSYTLAISDKERISDTYCVATSLNYPSLFPTEVQGQMCEVAELAAKSVGIENGATHIEMIVNGSGPRVIDFGARGGGAGFIPAVIVPHVSGVNMIQEMIRMVLGQKPSQLQPKYRRGAVYRFFAPPPGRVTRISGLEEASKIDGIADFRLNIKVGNLVPNLTTQLQRVGYFVVFADTLELALKKAEEVERLVEIDTQ